MVAGTGKGAEVHVVDENAFAGDGMRASKAVHCASLLLGARLPSTG